VERGREDPPSDRASADDAGTCRCNRVLHKRTNETSGRRLRRPLVIAGVAGSMYLTALATSDACLALEPADAGTGAIPASLPRACFMRVDRDAGNGKVFTRAGTVRAPSGIRRDDALRSLNAKSGQLDDPGQLADRVAVLLALLLAELLAWNEQRMARELAVPVPHLHGEVHVRGDRGRRCHGAVRRLGHHRRRAGRGGTRAFPALRGAGSSCISRRGT
jgi:hypothetical protein